MVVRVEDLVQWGCAEPSGWSSSLKTPAACGINGLHKPPQSSDENVCEETTSEPLVVKIEDDPRQGITILSYPQYCRFRSLQSRILEGARGPGLQEPHLLALGGVQVLPHIRLMYCRDTFNHPTLENSAGFSWQFSCPSLSLRGRPRKRKARDSPTSGQSDSWIERMKENVMGSVEVGCEGSWLPHPEEQTFLDQLFAHMERLGSPVHKVPNLGFKKIDLFKMYSVVKRLGGYKKVTVDRLWKIVYNELGGCAGSTSAATCTRRHYERLMLPYEEHLRAGGTEFKIPECPMPQKPRAIRGRKPLQRGRKPGPKSQEKKMATAAAACARTIMTPNGTLVVKRGRGRPPGTRNKSTLIAQAKMVAQQQARIKLEAESQLLSPLLQGGGALTLISTHRPIQPVILVNMPLTPDLSPMSAPFLPFQPKPKELNSDRRESAPPLLLSTLPRHFVGGSLGGFSPIKGVCPLDVFRNRISLQRGPESPALTPQDPPAQHHPTVYTLQPKSGSPDTPTHPSREQLQPQPHPPPAAPATQPLLGVRGGRGGPAEGGQSGRQEPAPPAPPPCPASEPGLQRSGVPADEDSSGLVSVPDLHPPPVRGSVPGPEQQAPLLAHHSAPRAGAASQSQQTLRGEETERRGTGVESRGRQRERRSTSVQETVHGDGG
ncbi:arginine-glutamic acid dipeptide repeats protein isoform X2 [Gymnodraco acuticeps]|nr:arginine-glutamic acid dipeptide repeats protein isoform X2 [Gymnodraco acuticeps]